MIRKNSIYNFSCILLAIFFAIFGFTKDIKVYNFSRICNMSIKHYLIMLFLSIMFGILIYLSLNKLGYKYKYLGLISLIIGMAIPYNYLNENAISSNIHLLCAYISVIIICITTIIFLFRIKMMKLKYANYLIALYIVVSILCFDSFVKMTYVNTICELSQIYSCLFTSAIIFNTID